MSANKSTQNSNYPHNPLQAQVPLSAISTYSTLAGSGTRPSGGTSSSRGPDVNAQALTRSKPAEYFCTVPGCRSKETGFTERTYRGQTQWGVAQLLLRKDLSGQHFA
ncbi:hypothetical protein CYLTODRAFT_463045 [Cylindrobasidium torrendii FP15055 ss-10]|uniref:Uncharacterized protein n=1 Tax=Cylindrobasidium torrendii FP15055 ss-10 TaxID=1314674 RepID=A0A0D7BSF6_9AGAR|nr:hypothetical protein CYLTODRAFT_463045 [Cylindrobasidium torrendii FP15055 ss-10]